MSEAYFGAYHRFKTASKKEGGALMSADNLVGGRFSIEFERDGAGQTAWLANRFGKRVGYFEPGLSRQLQLYAARGLELAAVLSYVGFSSEPAPGEYFGECAVIAYDPAHDQAFSRFIEAVGKRTAEGMRPKVDLGAEGAAKVIESGGAWLPKQTMPQPPKEQGVVIVKDKQSLADRAVEQGRAGNKGCYAGSILFIIAVVALVAFGFASCSGLI